MRDERRRPLGVTGVRGVSWHKARKPRVRDAFLASYREGDTLHRQPFSILQFGLRVAFESACDSYAELAGEAYMSSLSIEEALAGFLPVYARYWSLDPDALRAEALVGERLTAPGEGPERFRPIRELRNTRKLTAQEWAQARALWEDGVNAGHIRSLFGTDGKGRPRLTKNRLNDAARALGWQRPVDSRAHPPEVRARMRALWADPALSLRDIAASLGIGVDTVRRWATEEGLPEKDGRRIRRRND
ncbi:hypothetical protein J2T57_001631 [Natronocella acetinitrilica]|uniref:Uncharacterized protein n=1 Tax=Natronocella acetinitrilica TaxID=414046 RepID=A0AAE3G2N9_9GAMM|nr:DUF1804 family protein [Natronocella acetinitrilica]MCP1674529.1 hypothetical protein [Natronocella acetinitrilica]